MTNPDEVAAPGDSAQLMTLGGVVQALDVLRGRLPRTRRRRRGAREEFPYGILAVGAALWGLTVGLVSPASALLMGLSGLTPNGENPFEEVDLVFFAGFVPLTAGLVAVLLSLTHWPLRDVDQYHRELFAVLLLVGIPVLVELYLQGSRTIREDIDDAELFAYGSAVIQALLLYLLVRVGARGLAAVHAERSAWPRDAGSESQRDQLVGLEELSADTPRYAATTILWLLGLLWGVIISTAAGAAAGTLLVPFLGTLVGAYFGAIYGLVPTAMGATFLVVVVSWRRDTDPMAAYRAVEVALGAIAIAVLVGLWPFLQTAAFTPSPWEDANIARTWLTVVPVVVLLLRLSTPKLAAAYITRVVASPEPRREA